MGRAGIEKWVGKCEACSGKVQLSMGWEQNLMGRVGKKGGRWFETGWCRGLKVASLLGGKH